MVNLDFWANFKKGHPFHYYSRKYNKFFIIQTKRNNKTLLL